MVFISILFVMIWTYVIGTESVEIENTDYDVFLTNTTTTYSDIPPDCKLLGTGLSGKMRSNITFNFTTEKTFWIGARVTFQRKLNPLGSRKRCEKNRPDKITLDDCTKECDTKFIYHNPNSCFCENDDPKEDPDLSTAVACEDDKNGLCILGECILYEKDIPERSLLCGAYEYFKIVKLWKFTMEDCTTKLNYICQEKVTNNTKTSWYNAQQNCIEENSHLMKRRGENISKYTNESMKYWIAPFRRQTIVWGSDNGISICVAARINGNQVLEPFTTFCNNNFSSLCLQQDFIKEEQEIPQDAYIINSEAFIGVVVAVCCVLSIVVVCLALKKMKCFWCHLKQKRQIKPKGESDKLNENQTFNEKPTLNSLSEHSMSSKDKTTGNSLPELSATYSNPLNSTQKQQDTHGKHNPEPLYESTDNIVVKSIISNSECITYSDPINTPLENNKENHLKEEYASVNSNKMSNLNKIKSDQQIENPYQSPWSSASNLENLVKI